MQHEQQQAIRQHARRLMEQNPPKLGEGLYEEGSRDWLRVRNAYQRWLVNKLAPSFPEVTLLEAVETIAPMLD